MDNTITPPGKIIRRTHQSDTHQELKRHDPDFYRDKDKEHEEHEPTDIYEDLTDVAIEALINLLKQLSAKVEQDIEISHNDEDASSQDKSNEPAIEDAVESASPQTNSQASLAAKAYAHAQEAAADYGGHVTEHLNPENLGLSPQVTLNPTITNPVIRDLEILKARGVKTLHLERAEDGGVIASITQAIAKIL